jgi:hypothetical protein
MTPHSPNPNDTSSPLLTPAAAAAFLGVSIAFLARDRWTANMSGPTPLIPFVRVGPRAVRYARSDLLAHIEKNRTT